MKNNYSLIAFLIKEAMSRNGIRENSSPECKAMYELAKALKMDYMVGGNQLILGRSVLDTSSGATIPGGAPWVPPVDFALLRAGAQLHEVPFLSEYHLPRFDDLTPEWLAETDNATTSDFSSILHTTFRPLRMTVFADVAKSLIDNISEEAVGKIVEALRNKMIEAVDSTAFGVAARDSIQFQGIGYKITEGTDTATAEITLSELDDLVEIERELITNQTHKGSPVWVTSPKGALLLKTTPLKLSGDYADQNPHSRFFLENGKVLELPVIVSRSVSDSAGSGGAGSLLMLGEFTEVALVQFGGWQLTVDAVTLRLANKVRLVLTGYFDCKGLKGSVATDAAAEPATQPDEYGYVVASAAIK